MEFRKIDDTKFQCLLYEEDLEDNNISLDDFFRNDTDKIHGLLDVVMEEAHREIGVEFNGGVMSLQLAPQPNHYLLLTVSSGNDDFADMLKQAGENAAKAFAGFGKKGNTSNVIKSGGDSLSDFQAKPYKPDELRKYDGTEDNKSEDNQEISLIAHFKSMDILEMFCQQSRRTWGVSNYLYQDREDKSLYLILKRGRCSATKFEQLTSDMTEFAGLSPFSEERQCYIEEHYKLLIPDNAINIVKKYCE